MKREDDFDADISRAARLLHREWDSPELWARIQAEIAHRPPARTHAWRWALAMAATVVLAMVLARPFVRQPQTPSLLTDEALRDVERAETAYAHSIDRLAALAGPTLEHSPAPLAAAYREKLELLDGEIAELKRTAAGNRYNAYVETQLASLYHEKQTTLQDWLKNAKQN